MLDRRIICCLMASIMVLVSLFLAGPVVAAEQGEGKTQAKQLQKPADKGETASGLDGQMRDEFRSRAASYQGDYAGSGGKTSSIQIHWPTVLLIVLLLILL